MNNTNSEIESAYYRTKNNNDRLMERHFSSQPLQPYFSPRAVPTKYFKMPIVDSRKEETYPVKNYPNYNTESIFNPGSSAPWSGFTSNINNESILRNQVFAIQECSQATYVPGSKSDLYQVHWKQQKNIQQPFPDLFKKEDFAPIDPNPNKELIGFAMFNNSTRQQNKDLDC
jgi:hypothetical protein